ncbi:uncharacterized protein Dwil_GK11876 [Drosophila willistoni]|uniref:Glutathione transferase n=1 Tax=Drosophila willistoni TaxID=7260 RepID=B4NBD6_DROWI|nr:glutathione S-transferase 1-1 [Drosophila willistoni]EDW81100.1 uncharacterized protein Dwil_GK11876 [Drosophila willistoni]
MELYYLPTSPPCRAVIMAAKAVGVDLKKTILNSLEGETLRPEFVKINPQHIIPTLVDNGFAVWESRAILIYLVEKYAKDDSLYPKDPQQKAVVNQRLYFDMGTLTQSFAEYYYPQWLFRKPADPEAFKKIDLAFFYLNTFLENQEYVAGDHLTIADIAILATVSSFIVAGIDISKYSNVEKWYANAQKITPGWDENCEGLLLLREWIDRKINLTN